LTVGQPTPQAHGANAGIDEELVMTIAEDSVPQADEPVVDWVFACATTLGSVVPNCRKATFNDQRIPYSPLLSVGPGARWCSQQWLDRAVGERGPLAPSQGGLSLMGMHIQGRVTKGRLLVVADDDLDAAAAIAEAALGSGRDDPNGLIEWSLGVARINGETLVGVTVSGMAEGRVADAVHDAVGIQWDVSFTPGLKVTGGPSRAASCSVRNPTTGQYASIQGGEVHLEDEPVPAGFLGVAFRQGSSLVLAANRPISNTNSGKRNITLPNMSCRPLEPDERGVDRNYEAALLGLIADGLLTDSDPHPTTDQP